MAELQGETDAGDKRASAATEKEATGPEEELSDQEKMDQLMAELQGETDTGDKEVSAAIEKEATSLEETPGEQEKMEPPMAELQGETNAGEKKAAAAIEKEATNPEEVPGEQEKMDQLMAEPQGETGAGDKKAVAATENEATTGQSEEPDAFQPLDDDEADLDGYSDADEDIDTQAQETFVALDDAEEDLDIYDDEGTGVEPESGKLPEVGAGPDSEIRRKPVARERKSLFKMQAARVDALQESTKQSQWVRIVLVSSGMTVLLAGLFVGLMVYKNRGDVPIKIAVVNLEHQKGQPVADAKPEVKPEAPAEQGVEDTRKPPGEYPADHIIQDRFETIDAIRQSLQVKQAEIAKLKKEYEAGIEQSIIAIAEFAADKKIKSFKAAIAFPRIAFELRTIQRRRTYIRKLDAPYNRLLASNEALLYIKRLTEIDLAVAPFVGGLGTGRLLKRIDTEIDVHQLTSDKLLVEAGDTGAPELESLWRETLLKNQTKTAKGTPLKDRQGGDVMPVEEVKLSNSEIWEQICNGRPDNKYRVTELSSEAAECLAKWKGKELFLNRLTTLTTMQAREIAAWKGEWIGLNGLTEMDQMTARALFKWKGKRLSLNGFTEFPPATAKYLAKWKGKQLELMGLEVLPGKTAAYFSQWKKTGGKLYIPNKFYRRK